MGSMIPFDGLFGDSVLDHFFHERIVRTPQHDSIHRIGPICTKQFF